MDLTDQDLKDILNLVVKKRATPKMCVTGATVYEVEYKGATIYPLVGRRRGRRQILSMYDWSEDDE